MVEPILRASYWRKRLQRAVERHRAIYLCTLDTWEDIEAKHRQILAKLIGPNDSILDAGCGWGRLLNLLPPEWNGVYLGVDLCPEFLDLARHEHPNHSFLCADLLRLSLEGTYDWAIMVSIRTMVLENLGQSFWERIEANLRRYAKRLLYLEYRINHEGSVE